ncbi:hypothetical protein LOAG_04496 [Loa loa]|uniref:C2H2-type domain-containing protein n=1 Tax=Loa loa TaxID=7209 RepID=A0A1I7VSB9_LOALO|nr:hypothetical protein LOAG_04496 [Loa loa]EFO23992.1 hypothetical protein LOAG_04496 [Loa loa]
MLSDKKTCWTTHTKNSLPHSCATNVNRISIPVPDIGELVNRKGLINALVNKATPLSIYTRINLARRNSKVDTDSNTVDGTNDKQSCSLCSSKMFCLCRNCVNHKIKFVERYGLQRRKQFRRQNFLREIGEILEYDISLGEALHSTYESIEYLKQNILDKKKAIKKKSDAVKIICSKTERYRRIIEELKERCLGHQKVLCGPPNSLQAFVDAYEDKLQKIVKFNAQWFLKIFPIQRVIKPEPIVDEMERRCREMIAEACQEEFTPSTDKALAPMECGTSSEHCYTVCDCDAPDRVQYKILKGWLSIGIPTAPVARPVHNMFAAFVYTIQLVNLLTVNFDVCIPEQISYQEFSACRKWTEGLFDTDIFKLNRAVVMLCLSLGIESKLIEPLNPFANLLLLSNIMNDPNSVPKPGHHTLANELAVVLEEDLRQISWAERERMEEDEWYMVRYRDNYYDETYDISSPLRSIPSLNDLEEMLRDFSAFALPSSRMSEHDFQCILEDASRQHSPEFLPRVLNIFRNFSSK